MISITSKPVGPTRQLPFHQWRERSRCAIVIHTERTHPAMNGFSGEGTPITFLRHEINEFADLIAARLDGTIRAIIREELKMTDQAILDLTAAVDSAVAQMGLAVTEMQSEANALAAALAAN